jgi:hypothetical protein
MRGKLLLAAIPLVLLLASCRQPVPSPGRPALTDTLTVPPTDTATPAPETPTGTPTAEPTNTSTPEPTPEPTDTPEPTPTPTPEDVGLTCEKETFFTVGTATVWRLAGGDAFFFEAGMAIDADGAPDAYHPDDVGKDYLANAGYPGNWWALVTDTGQPDGTPIVQGDDDPNPGYYVSTTALEDRTKVVTDPRRYVNSNEIPFVVLPYDQRGGARLGDLGVVVNRANGTLAYVIFADLGPKGHIGEGSIALAEALGINADPRRGGASGGVIYVLFPNSGDGTPRSVAEINAESARLFEAWGGLGQVGVCFPE